jgi:cytochrome c2
MPCEGNPVNRFFLVTLVLLGAACNRQEPTLQKPAPPVGDAARGKQLVAQYGCTSCHVIPGIDGPRGEVGPSLEHVAVRQLIALKLPNNLPNMMEYLQNPQLAGNQNVMPNLGLKPEEARDIAAYLYTLK